MQVRSCNIVINKTILAEIALEISSYLELKDSMPSNRFKERQFNIQINRLKTENTSLKV